jgi:hypothetical protein
LLTVLIIFFDIVTLCLVLARPLPSIIIVGLLLLVLLLMVRLIAVAMMLIVAPLIFAVVLLLIMICVAVSRVVTHHVAADTVALVWVDDGRVVMRVEVGIVHVI